MFGIKKYNKYMKECCKKAIKNYKRNEALFSLQEVAKTESELNKNERQLLIAFIEGMKNK